MIALYLFFTMVTGLAIDGTVPKWPDSPLAGYTVAPMKWTGAVYPGGPQVILNGSIEASTFFLRSITTELTCPF